MVQETRQSPRQTQASPSRLGSDGMCGSACEPLSPVLMPPTQKQQMMAAHFFIRALARESKAIQQRTGSSSRKIESDAIHQAAQVRLHSSRSDGPRSNDRIDRPETSGAPFEIIRVTLNGRRTRCKIETRLYILFVIFKRPGSDRIGRCQADVGSPTPPPRAPYRSAAC